MATGYDEKRSVPGASYALPVWRIVLYDRVLYDATSNNLQGLYLIGGSTDAAEAQYNLLSPCQWRMQAGYV